MALIEDDPVQRPTYLNSVFLGSFAFVFLNFSLPYRADDLNFGAVEIGGMYAVFTGALLIFRPLIGLCLDRFGRRPFFIAAFMFYIPSMLIFSVSDTVYDFYLARFLQGVGASLMWVSAKTLTIDLNNTGSVGVAMGKLTTVSIKGSMIGATYGFMLLSLMPIQSAWVWAFAGYTVTAICAFIVSFLVDETQPRMSLGVSVPIVGKSIAWSPSLIKALTIVFLSSFASALIEPIYLLYLKNKFDANIILLAFVFLPAGLVHAILPRYSGKWSDTWGRGQIIAIGLILSGCLSIALPMWNSLFLVAVSYIVFAIGWAMTSPAEDALVADVTQSNRVGTTIGIKESTSGIGAALGPLVGGVIYEYWAREAAFIINGMVLLIAATLVLHWFVQKHNFKPMITHHKHK